MPKPIIVIIISLLGYLVYQHYYTIDTKMVQRNGKEVPAFPALQGKQPIHVTKEDILKKDGPYLVHFWGTWCGACRYNHSNLVALHKEYGIPIIGISLKDSYGDMEYYLQNKGNPFLINVIDSHYKFYDQFGIRGVPTTFFIDKDNQVNKIHLSKKNIEIVRQRFVQNGFPIKYEIKNYSE